MRLGYMKPLSLQSQPITCYLHDLNPGCASRLHEPQLPHRGGEGPGLYTDLLSGLTS